MLQSPDLLGKLPAASHDRIAVRMAAMLVAETMPPLLDGGLEFKGQFDLLGLDHAERFYGSQELRRCCAREDDLVQHPVALCSPASSGDVTAKPFYEKAQDGEMAVCDVHGNDWVASLGLGDTDASVCVKEPGPETVRKHHYLRVVDRMLAKSGEVRCPAHQGAEGQSRTKQSGDIRSGVRNEHGPTPKGKMCSELGRNVERSAEMTGPDAGISMCESVPDQVTDCNTDYVHFVVDPRFMFDWSEPLTYPNQLAYTRICGLRLFLAHKSRMFQAVLDGWSA